MKLKLITTASDRSKCAELERSLKHFGYDYHIIEHEWSGFLNKIHYTYQYLKTLEGYTHFVYTDAWDTFALRPQSEIPLCDGLLFSAERACYPHPEKEYLYPLSESPFHFVNGGGWMGEISAFIKMYELCKPTNEINDQVYLTDQFLKHFRDGWIKLDYECNVFQTLAFCPDDNFKIEEGKLINTITKSTPILWHGNGHTPIDWVYKLL